MIGLNLRDINTLTDSVRKSLICLNPVEGSGLSISLLPENKVEIKSYKSGFSTIINLTTAPVVCTSEQ